MIQAQSPLEREFAINAIQDRLAAKELAVWQTWKSSLLKLMASIEVGLDFEDVQISDLQMIKMFSDAHILRDEVREQLNHSKKLISTIRGAKVAIIGPPNVGKSSLMNYLAEEDISIVTDIPGTTRDSLGKEINLGKLKIQLIDTAGIRSDSTDVVEKIGIKKSL